MSVGFSDHVACHRVSDEDEVMLTMYSWEFGILLGERISPITHQRSIIYGHISITRDDVLELTGCEYITLIVILENKRSGVNFV